nr:hypothetical protein [Clostridium pasteurianum]
MISSLKEEYQQNVEIIENTQMAICIEVNIFLGTVKKVKEYGFNF